MGLPPELVSSGDEAVSLGRSPSQAGPEPHVPLASVSDPDGCGLVHADALEVCSHGEVVVFIDGSQGVIESTDPFEHLPRHTEVSPHQHGKRVPEIPWHRRMPFIAVIEGAPGAFDALAHLLIGHERCAAGPEVRGFEGPSAVAHPPPGHHIVGVGEHEEIRVSMRRPHISCESRALVLGCAHQTQWV